MVGASAAGLTTAEALRTSGFDGPLLLVGDEPHLPYDRPPLSKQHLVGHAQPVRLLERTAIDSLGVDLELGCAAESLDRDSRQLTLSDGRALAFDTLVIATGVRARKLRQGHELTGVHTLRSVEDADRIRTALKARPRVAVVGGGFLGAEVASSVRRLGLEVTWLFPEAAPMAEVLGFEIGSWYAARHSAMGVAVEPGVLVEGLVGRSGAVVAVQGQQGSSYAADLVIVCIGAVPNVEWLSSSGLSLTNGVDCDEFCRADTDIYAAGDVASWQSHVTGRRLRLEHRQNASEQALLVAENIVNGCTRPFTPTPYFWTDQYDARLQVFGFPGEADRFEVAEGSLQEGRFVGAWTSGADVVAVGGIGHNRAMRAMRAQLAPRS